MLLNKKVDKREKKKEEQVVQLSTRQSSTGCFKILLRKGFLLRQWCHLLIGELSEFLLDISSHLFLCSLPFISLSLSPIFSLFFPTYWYLSTYNDDLINLSTMCAPATGCIASWAVIHKASKFDSMNNNNFTIIINNSCYISILIYLTSSY